MPPHPFSLFPLGNLLTHSPLPPPRHRALGLFSLLSDSLIHQILDSLLLHTSPLLSAKSLSNLSATSTALRLFSHDEDLWRRLTLSNFPASSFTKFSQSWRFTFLSLVNANPLQHFITGGPPFFSDVLFHKWRCLKAEIDEDWLICDDFERIDIANVSVDEFRDRYESPGVPVVIQGVVKGWQAYTEWHPEGLEALCGDTELNAGGYNIKMHDYLRYCTAIEGRDDQSLYVFDSCFADKIPGLECMYDVVEYFEQDMFKVFGKGRPDFRWLIVGPGRSGSGWHKDPNATSAWNAVIRGEKKWIMFPPHVVPPGVVVSGDEDSVTAPVSVMEWFLNFYSRGVVERLGGKEGVVKEGEMIFVPRGWWHCVLNTEFSVAVTQNYVNEVNVVEVARWMRDRPHQVSGCGSEEHAKFVAGHFARFVAKGFPHLADRLREFTCHRNGGRKVDDDEGQIVKKRRISLWESLRTNQVPKPDLSRQSLPIACQDETHTTKALVPNFSFGF